MAKQPRERVLVVGATGFLGPVLVDELSRAGFHVVCGVRNLEKAAIELNFPDVEFLKVDLNNDLDQKVWFSRLAEYKIDRIVNNVGIATTFGGQSIENVNVLAPLALFEAMRHRLKERRATGQELNGPRVVQISTTGVDWSDCKSFPYPASKLKADEYLGRMEDLPHVIVRPNIIYEPERGHLLLEQIARIPVNFFVGHSQIQPVHCREVAIGVGRLLKNEVKCINTVLRAVGPMVMTWKEVFEDSALALGKRYLWMCPVPLLLAQAVTMLVQLLPKKILQKFGILSKMSPQTIVMMTKGSTGSNAEWLRATCLQPISLASCYREYAKGAGAYSRFIENVRKTLTVTP